MKKKVKRNYGSGGMTKNGNREESISIYFRTDKSVTSRATAVRTAFLPSLDT